MSANSGHFIQHLRSTLMSWFSTGLSMHDTGSQAVDGKAEWYRLEDGWNAATGYPQEQEGANYLTAAELQGQSLCRSHNNSRDECSS